MGTGQEDRYRIQPAPRRKKKFTVGMLALILLIVNATVTTFGSLAVGSGPQGLALGALYVFFTIPLTLYAAFLGILSLTGKQGRIPGAIALIVTSAAFLYAIYSMVQEGLT
jgi:glucan phosphoethanolaminetransferase (alkaline phosphatase superfamily)